MDVSRLPAAQVEKYPATLHVIQAVNYHFLPVAHGKDRPGARRDSHVLQMKQVDRRAGEAFLAGDGHVFQMDVLQRAIRQADHANGGFRLLARQVANVDIAECRHPPVARRQV